MARTVVFIVVYLLTTRLTGQVVFVEEDCFHIGEWSRVRESATDTTVPLPSGVLGQSGEYHWDFINLAELAPKTAQWDVVAVSDGGLNADTAFPRAEYAVRSSDLDRSVVQGWQYYSLEGGGRRAHGAYLEAIRPREQINPEIVHSPPPLDLKLPLRFGDRWTSETSYVLRLNVLFGPEDVRNEVVTEYFVDAWGTVRLPGMEKKSCLRVNELRTVTVLLQGVPIDTIRSRSYAWFAPGAGEVARVTSVLHSSILGPPGVPLPEFEQASIIQLQIENSRVQRGAPDLDPVDDQVLLDVDIPFRLELHAGGEPRPSFELVEGPGGMTVDPTTGLIEWTPSGADTGKHPVTVSARNTEGESRVTFSLSVVNTNEAPRGLRCDVLSREGVELAWEAPAHTQLLSGFEILHSAAPGGPYDTIAVVDQATSAFVHASPLRSSNNYYTVLALLTLEDTFRSRPSNEATTRVVEPTDALYSHNDGSVESEMVVGRANAELAVQFTADVPGELVLVAVYIDAVPTSALDVKLYDQAAGRAPGPEGVLLNYPASVLRPGWNVLEIPDVFRSGIDAGETFFVGILEGEDTDPLGLDESSSGHSWIKAPDRPWSFFTGGELMICVVLRGAAETVQWKRGDANSDASSDLGDAVFILTYLFANGQPPECIKAADVNNDTRVDVSDSVFLLRFLFAGGPGPAAPSDACGTGEPGNLPCVSYSGCD